MLRSINASRQFTDIFDRHSATNVNVYVNYGTLLAIATAIPGPLCWATYDRFAPRQKYFNFPPREPMFATATGPFNFADAEANWNYGTLKSQSHVYKENAQDLTNTNHEKHIS